jgi:hypothetical protein
MRTRLASNLVVAALAAAGLVLAANVLQLPWLVQPWQQLWAALTRLWA